MNSRGVTMARIQMLDNSVHTYDVKVSSYANVLLHTVMRDLNLLESDYFGIQYKDKEDNEVFLDPLKKIHNQIPGISKMLLKFAVKFFPPDPCQLQEEYTRYLFALQVKQDISHGVMLCSENTLAILAAYIAQAEFGDWNSSECYDASYLKDLKILPIQYETMGKEIFTKISERHKSVMGETPDKADFHLLDIARRLQNFGVRMHPAKDQENSDINLAVSHAGVVVFRGNMKINAFNWARIRKLSFKKKRFLIKLKSEALVDSQSKGVGGILVFLMSSRNTCKMFWRSCIEYHAFFRLDVRPSPKPQPLLLKRGSTFRFSGRTQKQVSELVQTSGIRRSTFTRVSSRKSARRRDDNSWRAAVKTTAFPSNLQDVRKTDSIKISSIPSPIKAESSHNGHIPNNPGFSVGLSKFPPGNESPDLWQMEGAAIPDSNLEFLSPKIQDASSNNHPRKESLNNSSIMPNRLASPDILNGVDCALNEPVCGDNSADDAAGYRAPYLSKNILSIESVSSSSKSSRSSVRRSSSDSSRRSYNHPLPPPPPPPPQELPSPDVRSPRSNGSLPSPPPDPLKEDYDNFHDPPPLPPKLSSSQAESPLEGGADSSSVMEDRLADIPYIESTTSTLNKKSALRDVRLREPSVSLSASEISIPSLAGGEVRTPSQYEMLEQKMIKAGFYSVPKKPPIPPSSKSAVVMNSDIDEALNELDLVTKNLGYHSVDESGDKDGGSPNDSHNGLYGVVVESDDDSKQSSDNDSLLRKQLLTPIQMQFNDRYTGPDYGSTDALSSFAVEMEASFDRIKQSLSNDRLDNGEDKGFPIRRPFTGSTDVVSGKNNNQTFIRRFDSNQNGLPENVEMCRSNRNNYERHHQTPLIRRDSDDVVDL